MEFSLVDETDILTQGDEKGSVQLLQAAIKSTPSLEVRENFLAEAALELLHL